MKAAGHEAADVNRPAGLLLRRTFIGFELDEE